MNSVSVQFGFPFLLQIPFSKFYLSHKGIVQDKQAPVETSEIGFFCINLMDNVDGPFHLEIDYIALLNDQNHKEEHAYERYSLEDHVVNVYWRPQIHCVVFFTSNIPVGVFILSDINWS